MEDLKVLIEKYFDGALTVEEERVLQVRLLSEEVPEELQADRELILAMSVPRNTDAECDALRDRMSAMIDALEEQEMAVLPSAKIEKMPPRRHSAMPRIVWSMVAMFAVAVSLLFVYDYEKQSAGDATETAADAGDNSAAAKAHENDIAAAVVVESDTNIVAADAKPDIVHGNLIAMADGVKKSDNRAPACDNVIVGKRQENAEPEHRENDEDIQIMTVSDNPVTDVYGDSDMEITITVEDNDIVLCEPEIRIVSEPKVMVCSEPEMRSKYNVDTFDNSRDAEVYLSELLSSISSSIDENREAINRTANSIRTALDDNLNNI